MAEQHDLNKPVLSVRGRFWINIEGVSRLGKGKIELLEKIRDAGTLLKAAAELNIPYRQAWSKVQSMNKLQDYPVVILRHGGKDRGNARVTEFGNNLINAFRTIESNLEKFLKDQAPILEFPGDEAPEGQGR